MKSFNKPIIGLEIHVELNTNSKMFCGCPANHFGIKPNNHTCPICLGLPGALPIPNKKAVEWTIMIGLALNCKISERSIFDRKHYFYPDLPKGFQISQYNEPICLKGYLETSHGNVRITRVHLEEDTGKLLHKKIKGKNVTLVDFNRSGVPLVEIVTEPEIHSAAQAKEFSQKLQNTLRFLEVSDCDMEKGSMRLEANISLGMNLGYKVEVKNLNSFRFLGRAIDYEYSRQRTLLDQGKTPKQETRGWSETENKTISQRYKETEADYRYFPEPDIPPMRFSKSYIKKIKKSVPELPDEIADRLIKKYGIRSQYATVLISDRTTAKYAEEAFKKAAKANINANEVANLIVNRKINIDSLNSSQLIENLKKEKSIQVSDHSPLENWINQALDALPQAVSDYKSGKEAAIAVLIGKVMQLSQGRANASIVREILKEKLQ